MKVLVLGAGVVGTTSAYFLAKAGQEVTVVDRQPGAGLETSFANAGQVSPGYSAPWAAPGIPLKALRWLMMRHRPFVIWPRLDARLGWWLAQMLANCTEDAYRTNKGLTQHRCYQPQGNVGATGVRHPETRAGLGRRPRRVSRAAGARSCRAGTCRMG